MRRDTSKAWLRAGGSPQLSEGLWQPQYTPRPGMRGREVRGVLGLSLPHPSLPVSQRRELSRGGLGLNLQRFRPKEETWLLPQLQSVTRQWAGSSISKTPSTSTSIGEFLGPVGCPLEWDSPGVRPVEDVGGEATLVISRGGFSGAGLWGLGSV